jgi:hypothetical protein
MAPKKKKLGEKKVVSSTKKAAKASKPTAETPVMKRYKKARNPAVEQAVMELLSHKYSIDITPRVREILARIKECLPNQVNDREIKQVWDLLHLRKKRIGLTEIPFYNQPYNKYCMSMEKVPDDLYKIFGLINSAIANRINRFHTIKDTNDSLKQLLFNDELIKISVTTVLGIHNALNAFKIYFKELSFHNKGVLLDDIKSHALYTNTGEEHHQRPHTDYEYPGNTRLEQSQYWFAWTAIMPTNSAGTCLNVWEKPGYPTNIHIKCGEIFFFRSDVVHSGGRLEVHILDEKLMYERLHFYLPTKLQPANETKINIAHFDRRTQFDDIYKVPINPWREEAKARKSDKGEDMEDGDKKPAAF